MPITSGSVGLADVKLGSTTITKVYVGTLQAWPSLLGAPVDVAASPASTTSVTLTWLSPGGTVTDYAMRYRQSRTDVPFFADDFNRTSSGIGVDSADWNIRSTGGTFNDMTIISNRARPSTGTNTCIIDRAVDMPANDYWAELTVKYGAPLAVGLLMRGVPGIRNEVGFEMDDVRRYDLVEFINDSGHNTIAITAVNAVPVATDIRVRGEVIGAQAKYFVNGTQILQGTLTTQLTGRRISFGCFDPPATMEFDDFACGTFSPGSWTTTSSLGSTALTTTISGLTAGVSYDFEVAAINTFGTGPWSATASSTPSAAAPIVANAPVLVSATAGDTTVALDWNIPTFNGGAAITDYIIQKSANGTTGWATVTESVSTVTAYTVTGLANFTIAYFRVAAVNSAGTGAYSNVMSATPTGTPSAPGIPTDVVCAPGDTVVLVSWTAPGTGGSAITDYLLQQALSPPGTSWGSVTGDTVSTATSTNVTGLTNGQGYVFRVAARNSIGDSAYSAASGETIPNASAEVLDTFERTDSSSLGGNWSVGLGAVAGNGHQIVSGTARVPAANTNTLNKWLAPRAGADQWAEVTFSTQNDFMAGVVICRSPSDDVFTGYGVVVTGGDWGGSPGGGIWFRLCRWSAGTETVIGGSGYLKAGTGTITATMRVVATGSTISGLIDGTERFSVTDTTHTTGRRVGIYTHSQAGFDRPAYQEFKAGA
jgi:hypothetical protein